MCIVFELLLNPQNVGVHIKSLPLGSAALSRSLKIRDVLLSVNDENTSGKRFTKIMRLIESVEDSSIVRLLFHRLSATDVI